MRKKSSGLLRNRFLAAGIALWFAAIPWELAVLAAQPQAGPNGSVQEESGQPADETVQPLEQTDQSAGQSGEQEKEKKESENTQPEDENVLTAQLKASGISYGQTLKNSKIEGQVRNRSGNPVKGTFTWANSDKLMRKVGTVSETVIFTPDVPQETQMLQSGEEPAGQDKEAQTRQQKADREADGSRQYVVWVTVEAGKVHIKELPQVASADTVYDGDSLKEVQLSGGTAVCIMDDEEQTQETVEGSFSWKNPEQVLEAGTQSCELVFTPKDLNQYQQAETSLELTVSPRKVELKLESSSGLEKAGGRFTFEASVPKTEKLTELNGSICFYIKQKDDQKAPKKVTESAPSKTADGWSTRLVWQTDDPGEYEISAGYVSADGHTADAQSPVKTVKVVKPLSGFEQDLLPEGREGKEYRVQLKTDASGEYPVSFAVAEGSGLPRGLSLDGDSGILSGTPQEHGEFRFTIEATEGDDRVSREFVLTVREKLTFSVSCNDISYGEKPAVSVEAAPKEDFSYKLTFEGAGETVYQESEEAPAMPGSYRVKLMVKEPADYEGQEIVKSFTIKKAVPKLSVKADPKTMNGGESCTLSITLENPKDPEEKENLPGLGSISVSFDRDDIKIKESIRGSSGSYTLVFETGDKAGTVHCSVSAEENSCYEAAEASAEVSVTRTEEETKAPEKETDSAPPNNNGGNGGKREESEPEPVRKTPEEIEAEFWQDVIFRIYKAQEKGETVTINAKGHKSLPDKVLEALRQHEKVSLALVWEGDMILIPAGKAAAPDKDHKNWTLAELAAKYPLASAAPQLPAETESAALAQTPPAAAAPGQSFSQNTASDSEKTQSGGGETDGGQQSRPEEEETVSETEEASEPAAESVFEEIELPAVMEEVPEGSAVDWFLVAAGICAVCGIIVVAIALAAAAGGKKKKDNEI